MVSTDKGPEDQKYKWKNVALKNHSGKKSSSKVVNNFETMDKKCKIYVMMNNT